MELRSTTRGRGQIVIHFTSNEEFERLQQLLVAQAEGMRGRLTRAGAIRNVSRLVVDACND